MNYYAITYKLIFNVFLDCLNVQRTFWNRNIKKITNQEAVWVQVLLIDLILKICLTAVHSYYLLEFQTGILFRF